MATKYYAVLTNVGAAKLANATALGAQVEITQMAVGDGNGVLPTPNPAQTALVHEQRRKPLNSLSVDPNNDSQIIAEQVIPENEGGWWIREIGLFDKDGDMIAVANCAETYKPQLQEGSGRVQVVRMILIVSSTEAVTLKIDPSVVLATRKYVDDAVIEVKEYVDQQLAAHVAAADPHTQYLLEADIDKYFPVGFPLPWPQATPPEGWLKCNGATFDKAKYPKLATAYTSGTLPDLRGEFLRGWDDGRGVDSGRALLAWQKGTLVGGRDDNDTGLDISYMSNGTTVDYGGDKILSASYQSDYLWYMDLGTVTNAQRRTAVLKDGFFNVTRPRNIAFNYIVRAA
ncbi:phage tail-collar fiber domain-containing protein [Enterobacter hormaechei]|uniref:phage tail-collar fiber domain-containing protein n=1 Tax=Enterobacter hormaechei TaxID=158836 RepID=UPI0027398527|nr:phage tail protein [Enterobacter hormaechei]HBN6636973.1 phage tail protein [Escherichia coli]MDZ5681752.1 phage tail protein [Enterobacter hormaechei]WLP12227.1 phage tail protein [Enterobacter hormaechei]HCD9772816.1 phage tail protein [Enterobacter hormaechei]HCE3973707.1 phage tail protein [Enterobacter hormaechei]